MWLLYQTFQNSNYGTKDVCENFSNISLLFFAWCLLLILLLTIYLTFYKKDLKAANSHMHNPLDKLFGALLFSYPAMKLKPKLLIIIISIFLLLLILLLFFSLTIHWGFRSQFRTIIFVNKRFLNCKNALNLNQKLSMDLAAQLSDSS